MHKWDLRLKQQQHHQQQEQQQGRANATNNSSDSSSSDSSGGLLASMQAVFDGGGVANSSNYMALVLMFPALTRLWQWLAFNWPDRKLRALAKVGLNEASSMSAVLHGLGEGLWYSGTQAAECGGWLVSRLNWSHTGCVGDNPQPPTTCSEGSLADLHCHCRCVVFMRFLSVCPLLPLPVMAIQARSYMRHASLQLLHTWRPPPPPQAQHTTAALGTTTTPEATPPLAATSTDKQPLSTPGAFPATLLEARDKQTGQALSDEQVCETVVVLM